MANIVKQIAEKVSPGDHVYYIDKNNKYDTKTLTDLNNEFEKFIARSANWHQILEAIYTQHGSQYVAAPKKGSATEFTVINTKKTTDPSFDVKMYIKDNALVIENLMNKRQTTIIETADVMDSPKESPTADKVVERLIKTLKDDYMSKTPAQVKEFLVSIVKTL